ncbi:MAG: GBS Bsp-like repeat-containing protein [Clostridiales bacterium]|nr:GBS Bsp-like repeat-containing protein [Clostridiales bacterium]
MKKYNLRNRRFTAVILALILALASFPCTAFAESVTYDQIVYAAMTIIIENEGYYSTVVRNDNGALSIGIIGWHATNALNLLKDIIARNPTQALSILGADLYNEIVTSSYWESKIPTSAEASAISVLISTTEGTEAQNESAYEYISGYVDHAIALGITDPAAMVFFADYQNQNGYTGASNFYSSVLYSYGYVTLGTLYSGSSQNTRRTRTYNFCVNLNWSLYTNSPYGGGDSEAPEISNVVISNLTSEGYTVSCEVEDNTAVTAVYFAVYYLSDGESGIIWYEQTPENGAASHTVNISEFSGRYGEYCTFIYAFDEAGNYAYVELNTVNVAEEEKDSFSVTVSSSISIGEPGSTVRWSAASSGGSGSYEYSFELYRDGVLIDKRAQIDYADWSYTASVTGEYQAVVTAYDTATGQTATAESKITDICNPITAESVAADAEAVALGQSVTWTVEASGGGTLYYQYNVYNNGEIVYSSSYTSSNSLHYKARTGGVYSVVVNITDEHSQAASVSGGTVTVVAALTVENIAFSSDYAVVGADVDCTVDISGGIGVYSCIFTVYCDGEAVAVSEELEQGSFTFTVSESGEYTVGVFVTSDETTVTLSGGELTADETAQRGDANCDGKVNAADARYALRIAAKLEYCNPALEYAVDANGDGKTTSADARLILRVSAKLESF